MIHIPQHGKAGQLNDIITFIPFIETLVIPANWEISVEWCSGENAIEIEKSCHDPWHGDHVTFCNHYKGIYQTIDGSFTVRSNKGPINLTAVDSSFWKIESDIPGIEDAFKDQYGTYESPFNK